MGSTNESSRTLPRLSRTNCAFVAPGIESWNDYSQKAGVGAKRGRAKLDQVTRHFELLRRFVPGLQANFIFGTDLDRGREPVELTRAFMNRLPFVWPAINVLIPYGGTPLHEKYSAHGRILKSLPLAFYCAPYLATTLEHYDPVEYYDHLIDMYVVMTSNRMLARRILAKAPAPIRIAHVLRTFAMRQELAEQRRLRKLLATDTQFRSFQEGRSDVLPDFFHRRITQRLGSYAELLSHADRIPIYVSSTQEPAAAAHSSSNSSATLGRLEA